MGLLPEGEDTRPLVLTNPRKSSVPSPGPSGPPRPKRGFTELRLGTREGAFQPRRGSRAGAFRSHTVLHGFSGEASGADLDILAAAGRMGLHDYIRPSPLKSQNVLDSLNTAVLPQSRGLAQALVLVRSIQVRVKSKP